MKFIIDAHPEKKEAAKLKMRIRKWLIEKGQSIADGIKARPDMAIGLGGDGYAMHTVRKYSMLGIPSLCINLGDVGFLTVGNKDNWKARISQVICGNYFIEKRASLKAVFKNQIFGPFANDIYLRHSYAVGVFRVGINNQILYNEFFADGIIVCTPTGTTGYNLGAGGPIVERNKDSMVITPICPGHLNIKPIVENPNAMIRIEVLKAKQPGVINLIGDGKLLDEVRQGDTVIVKKHRTKMLFVVLNSLDYIRALQEKKGLMK
jgi:NAD+ kinase